MTTNFLLTGLVRIWILVQARDVGSVFGQQIIDTLKSFDHHVSAGTVYPLLKRLEEAGYLRRSGSSTAPRRVEYTITTEGLFALAEVRAITETLIVRS